MIVTRADLARVAHEAEVGLRAGERRYALEHLLGQDAVRVLAHLAEEAGRQAVHHAAREPWLGPTATFQAGRARNTEALLTELAQEGESHLTELEALAPFES